jgi:glycosyltransferase involved in cell wall biosynthesis
MPVLKWIARPGESFIQPILERLRPQFTIKRVGEPGHADLFWHDWCDGHLVARTASPPSAPVIARLHSYEAFTPWPGQVKWGRVAALIFVADHVRERVLGKWEIEGPQILTIPNGFNKAKFTPRGRGPRGKKIGWVGGITEKKGPELFAQVVRAVTDYDPKYRFFAAGDFQEERLKAYFDGVLNPGEVEFLGHLEDMPAFYRTMDYVLSTSPWEGTQQSVGEGIACGCIPLVHRWPGAEKVYPMALHWTAVDELVGHLRRYSTTYGPLMDKMALEMRDGLTNVEHCLDRIEALVGRVLCLASQS